MLNGELKTLDYFLCIPAHDFGVFGPSFAKLAQYTRTYKTCTTKPTDNLDAGVKSNLMLNEELRALHYFSCDPAHDLGVFWPFFTKFS